LVAVLGVGGMATVYRVYDALLDVFRAVKVLDPDLTKRRKTRERFLNEARTMARLRHPNIVSVFDMGIDESRVFMLMELVQGGSVMERVDNYGPLAPRLAARVMIDVLRALELSHKHGVVHRDVKPHNVLLTLEGVPKVTDFGIAAVKNDDHHLTRTGAVMGTWAYMAPEQRKDAKSVDARSDVYASAATLYAIVTGAEPLDLYVEETHAEMLAGLPAPLADVVRTAASYRADQRYASAEAMAVALEECLVSLPPDPPGSLPVVAGDGDGVYERPDSDYDVSLSSQEAIVAAKPRVGADLPTMDDPTDDVPFDPKRGFDLDDLERMPAVRQSLPTAQATRTRGYVEPTTAREFELPPPPAAMFGGTPASDGGSGAPDAAGPAAPTAPTPASADALSAAGVTTRVSAALHTVQFVDGGLAISRGPLGWLVRASPRISHILLAYTGERFKCNVAVPPGKKPRGSTTPLRTEAWEGLVAGVNKRRALLPEGARRASVAASIGITSGALLAMFTLQLPPDLLASWALPLAGALLITGGVGALSLVAVPLALWSWRLARKVVLMYDLDDRRLERWVTLNRALDVVAAARVRTVVGGDAGVKRKKPQLKPLRVRIGLPSGVYANTRARQATVDGVTLTFMPEGLWMEQRGHLVSMVRWSQLVVQSTRGEDGDETMDLLLSGPGLDVVFRSRQVGPLDRLRRVLDEVSTADVGDAMSSGRGGGLGAFL
jgi:serine/threonine protein kinase